MKFYIRRAIAGAIATPFIAGAYTFVYLTFLILGGETNQTIDETYANGIQIGITAGIAFIFAPQLAKLIKAL